MSWRDSANLIILVRWVLCKRRRKKLGEHNEIPEDRRSLLRCNPRFFFVFVFTLHVYLHQKASCKERPMDRPVCPFLTHEHQDLSSIVYSFLDGLINVYAHVIKRYSLFHLHLASPPPPLSSSASKKRASNIIYCYY